MHFIVRPIAMLAMVFACITTAAAQDTKNNILLADLNLNIEDMHTEFLLADNNVVSASSHSVVPNIPDSAFEKPVITLNQTHMYLGLASMGLAGITGLTADSVSKDNGSANLKSNVHVVAAKAAWQLGALAIGTGLWTHWDDFHLEDGLLDRDNLHVLLGTLGVIGYYLAVNSAVSDYNTNSGSVSTDHASYGILGSAAMITGIALTW
ncbi:hypothetical protein [Ghiorsea bivora]|uniref:hypothetical protein n=1 Tax=Ghiorsea bivora TaxID=1485545 RepID=UPI000691B0EA|nr:hypothetical protein [Ghiorsea bivora]